MRSEPVLVTGATGYVGGRLIPLLLESGYQVRAMGRSPDKLGSRDWARHPRIELVNGDVFDPASLYKAAQGCWAAFYLVHSMGPGEKDFEEADRRAAGNMAAAAAKAGLNRIIFIGGLGDTEKGSLSKHLRSRHEVARILQAGPVPATFLRAAMILGSGSASFEIMRYLMERLPVILAPRWVRTLNQPIAIRNVLYYLRGCLEKDETLGGTFDIGGPDILSYQKLLEIYAEEAKLRKRRIIPVPFLTPGLSAYWIHLITPVPASLAVPLTQGLRNPVICKDNRIRAIVPQRLLSCREAISLALERIRQKNVETCWSDAGCLKPPEWAYCGDADYTGGTILECGYRAHLKAAPEEVWDPVCRIGGTTGWYFGNILWRIRGSIDRLAGGMGLSRGKRHHRQTYVGDALDFWRVLKIEPPRRLVLLSEMKLPGEALLEIEITPLKNGETELRLLSRFLPRGLEGFLYWFSLYPFHQWIFAGMLKSIAELIQSPITLGPERFTPKIPDDCSFPLK
ncbi:SDR family oxidoreductase [Desulfonema magnum]|uniref:NAD(P)-binding domain-containing protein, DUF2867 n=1 Tax=Desulfonema magnum TaxID=45655 RepID=A0A975GRE1_9BACT|nr:SDR family oxidoreductase [Desulfonema magnum]QTA90795.1 NAD(P)-binding domain-containing protein, DUF2867 [Desulfonema magnum]